MKLVRDCIPEIIEEDGKWCLTRKVHGIDEHLVMLKQKLVEESQEFMIEVVKAFCYLGNLEWESVLGTAVNKQETHGGFYRGIILERVGKE